MAYGIEPYENVFIGNFLYGLGLAIGHRRQGEVLGCVNLLQQTPLDPLLGDVLLDLPGTMRLFEFKRSTNRSAKAAHSDEQENKELKKANNLRIALRGSPDLVPLSREVHWLIQSMPTEAGKPVPVKMLPYLDFGVSQNFKNSTLSALIEDLVEEACGLGGGKWPSKALTDYLACVGYFQGSGSVSSGGLIVHVDRSGILRYAAVHDLRELRLHQAVYIEKQRERLNQIAQEREQAIERELERQRGRERDGPEMDI